MATKRKENISVSELLMLSKKAKRRKEICLLVIKYIFMAILAIFLLFPYVFMLSKSLMTMVDANSLTPSLFPQNGIRWKNYTIFIDYIHYFYNSLVVVVINGVFIPLSGFMVAYPFARKNFKGKNVMFMIMMSTVMLPGAVVMVPTYIMFQRLSLVDKLASQWIGAFWGGGAMNIFLMIQFLRGIPKAYDDAAVIDGASMMDIFLRILLPMCKNVLLFVGISTVIGRWSDFQGPLIYLTSPEKMTIAVAFYTQFNSNSAGSVMSNLKMAMAVCMTVLPMVLYLIFQKQMIGGIKIGGLKG
jgi:multiple sugar transport system permease protein